MNNVLILSAALAVAMATSVTGYCWGHSHCAGCIADYSGTCGWCASSNTCLVGGSTGPSSGGTCKTEWRWDSCSASSPTAAPSNAPGPVDCSVHTACGVCTHDASGTCGWCGYSQTCELGTSLGPRAGACRANWDWYTCSTPTTPAPIAPVPNPPAPTAPAPVPNPPAQTPAPVVNCGQHGQCSTCLTDASGTCGWCGYSQTCTAGTQLGPRAGACRANWDWDTCSAPSTPAPIAPVPNTPAPTAPAPVPNPPAQTPAPVVNCGLHGECGTCLGDASGACGWCDFTGVCESGTSVGPSTGSCRANWKWLTCATAAPTAAPTVAPTPAPSCYPQNTCKSCTAISNCGWCSIANTCEAGTKTAGPGCPSYEWFWKPAQCF